MPDFPKNGLFTSPEMQKQIDAIEVFTNDFIKENSSVFDKDLNDTFIKFNFSFQKRDGDKDRIDFGVTYDDQMPKEIQDKFDAELKKFLGK